MAPVEGILLGVDLGASYASIAVLPANTTEWDRSVVEVIASQDGDRQIPAHVAFIAPDILVGSQAKRQLVRRFQDVVSDFRRMDGEEEEIELSEGTTTRRDVMTAYLRSLKETAESYTGQSVMGAVLTTPVDASQAYRDALAAAAAEAQLDLMGLMPDSVATMLGGTLLEMPECPQSDVDVLVVDVGGKTTAVSWIGMRSGLFVQFGSTTTQMGGDALDLKVAQHFAQEFARKYHMDPMEQRKARLKLLLACETAKIALSNALKAYVSVESLCDGVDLNGNIARQRFELLAQPTLDGIMRFIHGALEEFGATPTSFDQVLLVGGTTKVPRLQQMLTGLFSQDKIKVLAEANAVGAVYEAHLRHHHGANQHDQVKMLAHNLVAKTLDGAHQTLVRQGHPLPLTRPLSSLNCDIIELSKGLERVIGKIAESAEKLSIDGDGIVKIDGQSLGSTNVTVHHA